PASIGGAIDDLFPPNFLNQWRSICRWGTLIASTSAAPPSPWLSPPRLRCCRRSSNLPPRASRLAHLRNLPMLASRNCEGFSRRDCLRFGIGGLFGGGLANALRARGVSAASTDGARRP